jgi:hypothetical protein
MGITDLNNITKEDGVLMYNDNDFDIIIVDGSNVIDVLIYGYKNALIEETDPGFILGELINGVYGIFVSKINSYKKKYHCKEIIITFDTPKILNYTIQRKWIIDKDTGNIIENEKIEYQIKQFKEEERELRKAQKSKPKKRDTFVDKDSNILSIIPLVIGMLIDTYEHDNMVRIIETQDEADFVIRNLVSFYSSFYDSILVVSEDTDYFILLCDIPNAYKTGAKRATQGIVYNPKQLFENLLHTSNYLEVIFISLFAGCDYTVHNMILSMKMPNNYKLLYNNPNELHKHKSLKFIKNKYIPYYEHEPDTRLELFIDIIQRVQTDLKSKLVDLMNLYYSWCFINKFDNIHYDIVEEYNKLLNKFDIKSLPTIKYNKLQELIHNYDDLTNIEENEHSQENEEDNNTVDNVVFKNILILLD